MDSTFNSLFVLCSGREIFLLFDLAYFGCLHADIPSELVLNTHQITKYSKSL
jgi:hypothetical protein